MPDPQETKDPKDTNSSCDEIRKLITTTNPLKVTPELRDRVTSHMMDCWPCIHWLRDRNPNPLAVVPPEAVAALVKMTEEDAARKRANQPQN